MSTTPPTTTAGAVLPPAQTAAPPEATMLEGVVDALRPMFGAQAPNIDTWKTRLLVERLLHEKASRGPLQGSDITVESLFKMATGGWDNPAVKSGALLRAACVILRINPVPTAPQPPAVQQPAVAPTTWGSFPAALPEVAETTTSDASDTTDTDDKAVKKAAKKAAARAAKKAAKKARQRALLAGIAAAVAAVAAVIAAATAGWVAFGAAITAVGAGIAGATIGAKTFASTKPPHAQ